jgi:hypothetical protein
MPLLIWKASVSYFSQRDEAAFFGWLQSIPGVLGIRGVGRELQITLRSKRLSVEGLRELIAIYQRYGGHLSELALFLNTTNELWFRNPKASWFKSVFGSRAYLSETKRS